MPLHPKRPQPRSNRARGLSLACVIMLGAGVLAVATPSPGRTESAPAPDVIPAVTEWQPGDGVFQLRPGSRIRHDASSRATARTLADDLVDRFGGDFPVVPGTDGVRPGDVVLRTEPEGSAGLGTEGYELIVASSVRITANAAAGTYYGTRTLLQAIGTTGRAAAGSIRDVPRYPDRGIGICPCALKVSVESVERLIADLGYLKLNYLLLPLKIKSADHPEINQWAYYTPDEARRIAAFARQHHVRIVPEINAPGHMEPFLFDRPDLQLTDVDGNRSATRIDITNPEAFRFYTDLIDEYAEILPGPEWHLGADEYMIFTSYERYPQIAAYAKEKFGPRARPEDAFIDFVNRVDAYVRDKHGMRLRIWNDGLPERNVVPEPGSPHPRLSTKIIIEHWAPAEVSAATLIDAGYRVTNAASSLYEDSGGRISGHSFCPDSARLADCLPALWNDGWSPARFEDGSEVDPAQERLTGAHLSLWQSAPMAETEVQLERRIELALRLIAQRTWGEAQPDRSFAEFRNTAESIGHAPAWRDPADDHPLRPGSYRIRSVTSPDRALLGPAGESSSWQVEPTDDGYHRLVETDTGRCLTAIDAGIGELLESAPAVGSTPTLAECAPGRQTQKWQLQPDDHDGLTMINAIHQLPIVLDDTGVLRLRPADQQAPERWRFDRADDLVGTLATAELLKPGQPNRVEVMITNHGSGPLANVTAELAVPVGWRAELTKAPPTTIEAGATVTGEFTVTPDPDAATDVDHRLTATIGYRDGAESGSTSRGRIVRIDPIGCSDPSAPRPAPGDTFDGTALNGCRWTDVQDPDLAGMQVRDGRLRIETGPSDLAGPNQPITNLLLQPATAGDWTIELKFTASLRERYQQAGLILHADDDNFVEYVLVSDAAPGGEPRYYLSLVSEQDGEFRKGGVVNVFDPALPADGEWWLRLTRAGDRFTGASSPDGETWTAMPGEVTNPKLAEARFGLFATGPGQSEPTTVAIDHFQLVS